jgi:hypothetical protein
VADGRRGIDPWRSVASLEQNPRTKRTTNRWGKGNSANGIRYQVELALVALFARNISETPAQAFTRYLPWKPGISQKTQQKHKKSIGFVTRRAIRV